MSKQQLQTLKGFRDFLPEEKRQREYVASVMKKVFERFAFAPLETPTLEYASLLLGKYGDEADKLVYNFTDRGEREVALRYDQTVPTARVLSQYQNELPKYFRRYQIQNVFRADKPQKGRFREFTQADCDIFGSTNGLADAEILAVFYAVYKEIGFSSVVLEYNDREVLTSILAPFSTDTVSVASLTQSIDKLDKVTKEVVIAELVDKGLAADSAAQALEALAQASVSPSLELIRQQAETLGVPTTALQFNPFLARGLDYYTGLIFEGKIPEYGVGSVGGGGRYDNLINQLSGSNIPAVGFGIGFDRTVEAAVALNLIPLNTTGPQVLVTVFSAELAPLSLAVVQQLRAAGIRTELYPTVDKLGKQFAMAEQKQIQYVVVIGSDEAEKNVVQVKNIVSGEKQELSVTGLLQLVNSGGSAAI